MSSRFHARRMSAYHIHLLIQMIMALHWVGKGYWRKRDFVLGPRAVVEPGTLFSCIVSLPDSY